MKYICRVAHLVAETELVSSALQRLTQEELVTTSDSCVDKRAEPDCYLPSRVASGNTTAVSRDLSIEAVAKWNLYFRLQLNRAQSYDSLCGSSHRYKVL